MGTVTDVQLADMQDAVAGLFPSSLVIWRPTRTLDHGQEASTWGTASGTIACRLSWKSAGGAAFIAGRPEEAGYWILTVAHDVDLLSKDRVVIDERTFEVTSVSYTPGEVVCKRAVVVEAQSV